jgi:hypothetical protein
LTRLDGHLEQLMGSFLKVQRRFEREVNGASKRNQVGLGHVLNLNPFRVLSRGGGRSFILLVIVVIILQPMA